MLESELLAFTVGEGTLSHLTAPLPTRKSGRSGW